jgi:hypothetical protein
MADSHFLRWIEKMKVVIIFLSIAVSVPVNDMILLFYLYYSPGNFVQLDLGQKDTVRFFNKVGSGSFRSDDLAV